MGRTPRRPTAVQSEPQPVSRDAEPAPGREAAPEKDRLALGWRIAIVVWLLGFLGLALFELWGFGSYLLSR